MANKWKKIYMIAAAMLCVSVIGMIVSGSSGAFPWFPAAVILAIVCIVARINIKKQSRN